MNEYFVTNTSINDDVLLAIDNIDSCVMEAEMNVIDAMYDYCQKALMMLEHYEGDNYSEIDVFCEADKVTGTKKTFGSRVVAVVKNVLGAIKRFFSFIGKQLGKLIAFVKRLFTGKKKSGTADQAVMEAGIKPNKSVHSGEKENVKVTFTVQKDEQNTNNTPVETPNSQPPEQTQTDQSSIEKKASSKPNETPHEFTVTAENSIKRTEEKVEVDIALQAKEICVKITENGELDIMVFKDTFQQNANDKPIKGQDLVSNKWYCVMAFAALTVDGIIDKFSDTVMEMLSVFSSGNNSQESVQKSINKYDSFIKEFDGITDSIAHYRRNYQGGEDLLIDDAAWNTTINIQQIVKIQKSINEILSKLDQFVVSEINNDVKMDQEFIERLQFCVNIARNSQMGLNGISAALSGVYKIDKRYVHTITDPDTLDKFVEKMINLGIPPKYVAYNAWLACDKNIVNVDNYTPVWGQSRIIFFPNDKQESVYKVALSSLGISANKSEAFVYSKATKSGIISFLAKPNHLYSTGSVLDMERIDTSEKTNSGESFGKTINQCLENTNMPFRIGDLHNANFGKLDGVWVALDYGNIYRTASV